MAESFTKVQKCDKLLRQVDDAGHYIAQHGNQNGITDMIYIINILTLSKHFKRIFTR
jgi:hypothetical protein